ARPLAPLLAPGRARAARLACPARLAARPRPRGRRLPSAARGFLDPAAPGLRCARPGKADSEERQRTEERTNERADETEAGPRGARRRARAGCRRGPGGR